MTCNESKEEEEDTLNPTPDTINSNLDRRASREQLESF